MRGRSAEPFATVSSFVYNASYRAMTMIAGRPEVALSAARLLHHGHTVDASTRLVIEGYPRSANSLAVEAVSRAGVPRDAIAHHTHTPANLLRGMAMGTPCLLVVRRPSEAVTEFVKTKPALSVGAALRGWISFHEPLMDHLDRVVVATFPQITSDMGAVVARINSRFSSAFPVPGEAQIAEARAGVDDQWAGRTGHGLPLLGRGRGSSSASDDPESAYGSASLASLRSRAESLFGRLELAAR